MPWPAEADDDKPISDQLESWIRSDGEHTLGGLADVFEEKSFALLFILLLGVSALPMPTGGATHVFQVIAILVAAQLVAGRDEIWIPKRWEGIELAGGKRQKFIEGLLKFIRFLERFAKPRLRFMFHRRLSTIIFGLVVIVLTTGAFFAPPFSGLDTLPSLGVLLISVGVLLEDFVLVVVGLVVGVAGVVLEIVLGKAAAGALQRLF